MKNLVLIGFVMVAMALTGCADPQGFNSSAAKLDANADVQKEAPLEVAPPALSLTETMLADLESNLRGVKAPGSTQSKLMISKTAQNLKLSDAQVQVVLATTMMAIDQANMKGTTDLSALIPVLVQGATLGMGALQLGDSSSMTGLLSAIGNSVLNSIVNMSQANGASAEESTSLLQTLTQSLFAGFQNSGVGSSNIKGIANSVISSILSRLNESQLSANGLDGLLKGLADGVVLGLGQLNMTNSLFSSVLNSLGQGSLSGLTTLVTNVLGTITTGSDGSQWLSQLMNAFTSGISGALNSLAGTGSLTGAAGGFLNSFLQGLSGQTPGATPVVVPVTPQTPTPPATTPSTLSTILGLATGIARLWMGFI